jgi:hypothetical protein
VHFQTNDTANVISFTETKYVNTLRHNCSQLLTVVKRNYCAPDVTKRIKCSHESERIKNDVWILVKSGRNA